jgi:hypothetical protein
VPEPGCPVPRRLPERAIGRRERRSIAQTYLIALAASGFPLYRRRPYHRVAADACWGRLSAFPRSSDGWGGGSVAGRH